MTSDSIELKPLRLPGLNSAEVRLFNAISLRGLRHTVKIKDAPMLIHWVARIPVFDSAIELRFLLNGAPWVLALSSLEMLKLHPIFKDPAVSDISFEDLPDGLLEALADVLIEPVALQVSQLVNSEYRFQGSVEKGDPRLTAVAGGQLLWADAESQIRRCFFRLSTSPSAAEDAAEQLRDKPRQTAGSLADLAETIPFDLAAVGGRLALSAADFSGLEAGDVLLPDEWYISDNRAALSLRVGTRTLMHGFARYQDGILTLDTPLEQMTETDMQNIDELEISLSFELDRRTLTVADLKSLEPGYVFKMADEEDRLVKVLANGRPIARGRLVDAGGVVGVQLTEKVSPVAEQNNAN